MRKQYIILIVLSTCACMSFSPEPELYNPDYTPEILVFSVISNDESYEFVIVERTLRINEYDERDANNTNTVNPIIEDAIVFIICDNDTVQFTFSENKSSNFYLAYPYKGGMYIDKENQFQAEPGKMYTLVIQTTDGRVLRGMTRVPHFPRITYPKHFTTLAKKSFKETSLQWQSNNETVAYAVTCLVARKGFYRNDRYYPPWRFDISGDLVAYESPTTLDKININFLSFENSLYSDTLTVKVTAMDRNIYDYAKKSQLAALTGVELNLIEGGLGVFGSLCVDSVDVVLE